MKNINQPFTDSEHRKLARAKKEMGVKNWHDFIMLLVTLKESKYCEACRREIGINKDKRPG